ncbi:conserved hypothetical protein [Neptunomonas japonica JAMM 1380]|uniref:DUF1289 domain-containing protein n=2 Tax=Neptunomonas TaxID=75687 RepID=A0A7R6SXW4_9GAMM|nr:conserved hypothetical protein [Neptunomonas japonica JAMM 1380]
MNDVDKVKSPCIRQCCLDEQDVCLGCGRSLQEILDWTKVTETERAAVLVRAQSRKKQRNQMLEPKFK